MASDDRTAQFFESYPIAKTALGLINDEVFMRGELDQLPPEQQAIRDAIRGKLQSAQLADGTCRDASERHREATGRFVQAMSDVERLCDVLHQMQEQVQLAAWRETTAGKEQPL